MAQTEKQNQRLEARVVGRVQGVSFRYYTQRAALSMGLTGWVRNEINGDVSTVAEGTVESLNRFLEFLYEGSPHARVDSVEVTWAQSKGCFQRFSIVG